ncbi:hypothetical protein DPMN_006168 [Dreissena polymorpha]|uniref:Uncharacterized protein n=1 Tax=Dreissena polymorpha TaxID=45954 RepID=A0A9D4MUX8_DREPO|nr:hypothetical protein DPMN_006168 [Dreissena polymorpha]
MPTLGIALLIIFHISRTQKQEADARVALLIIFHISRTQEQDADARVGRIALLIIFHISRTQEQDADAREQDADARSVSKKNAPAPDIIRMNLLTKFHKDRTINVASRPNKEKCPAMFFMATGTIFKLFHDDQTIYVASRVLKRYKSLRKLYTTFSSKGGIKMPRLHSGHVFQPTGTIFELIQGIIGTNLLTKFHEDQTINVASRVLTRKNALPPRTIFQLIQDINETNLLNKFHED